MTGTLLLAGSGEFRPPMVAVDRELLELTPGHPARVAIVPTAAGREHTVRKLDPGWSEPFQRARLSGLRRLRNR